MAKFDSVVMTTLYRAMYFFTVVPMILISVVHLFSRYGHSLVDAFVTVGKIMARKCWPPSPVLGLLGNLQKETQEWQIFFPSILLVTSNKSIRLVVVEEEPGNPVSWLISSHKS